MYKLCIALEFINTLLGHMNEGTKTNKAGNKSY